MKTNRISVVGAGLVGALLAILLRKKGFDVHLYEKRKDPRTHAVSHGRSINLALSRRGILPLMDTGIFEKIQPYLIPIKGRLMHDENGGLTSQSYGKKGEHIYSVARKTLNQLLIDEAEKASVVISFERECKHVDFQTNELYFERGETVRSDLIIATDGAFSTIRKTMQQTSGFRFTEQPLPFGYKELKIRPLSDTYALDPNFLHIWPRGNFMLIALPNHDQSFTCTLFCPFQGSPSFQDLHSQLSIQEFFQKYFKDVIPLIPDIAMQFQANPTSSMHTMHCFPWHNHLTLLLGDAAHTIVPFYGQGMNAGFEDARLLVEAAESNQWDWIKTLPNFTKKRKEDTDAISELALENFIEMRDRVADPAFLLQKELEAKIQMTYPNEWIPLYSMVTFSELRYSEALRLGKIQQKIIEDFINTHKNADHTTDFKEIITQFHSLKKSIVS